MVAVRAVAPTQLLSAELDSVPTAAAAPVEGARMLMPLQRGASRSEKALAAGAREQVPALGSSEHASTASRPSRYAIGSGSEQASVVDPALRRALMACAGMLVARAEQEPGDSASNRQSCSRASV